MSLKANIRFAEQPDGSRRLRDTQASKYWQHLLAFRFRLLFTYICILDRRNLTWTTSITNQIFLVQENAQCFCLSVKYFIPNHEQLVDDLIMSQFQSNLTNANDDLHQWAMKLTCRCQTRKHFLFQTSRRYEKKLLSILECEVRMRTNSFAVKTNAPLNKMQLRVRTSRTSHESRCGHYNAKQCLWARVVIMLLCDN